MLASLAGKGITPESLCAAYGHRLAACFLCRPQRENERDTELITTRQRLRFLGPRSRKACFSLTLCAEDLEGRNRG